MTGGLGGEERTEWVVDGDDKDFAGILEVLAVDVAGNVGLRAARGESGGDSNDEL